MLHHFSKLWCEKSHSWTDPSSPRLCNSWNHLESLVLSSTYHTKEGLQIMIFANDIYNCLFSWTDEIQMKGSIRQWTIRRIMLVQRGVDWGSKLGIISIDITTAIVSQAKRSRQTHQRGQSNPEKCRFTPVTNENRMMTVNQILKEISVLNS